MNDVERKLVEQKVDELIELTRPHAFVLGIMFADGGEKPTYYRAIGPGKFILKMLARLFTESAERV